MLKDVGVRVPSPAQNQSERGARERSAQLSDFSSSLTQRRYTMFDFGKLDVYQKAKSFNKIVYQYIQADKKTDSVTKTS